MRITVPLVFLVLMGNVAHVEADVPRLKIEHGSPILSVVWSPDGKWMATGSKDGTVRILEPVSGKEIQGFSTGEAVPELVVAADSRTLGIVSADQKNLCFRDFQSEEQSVKFFPPDNSTAFRFRNGQFSLLPKGEIAFGFQGGTYYVFVVRSQGITREHSSALIGGSAGAIACDGSAGGMYDRDGNLHVWMTSFGTIVNGPVLQVGKTRCLAFVPGWKYVAVGSDDANVHLWLWESSTKVATLTGLDQPADRLVSSHDGNTLVAVAAAKRRIVSWDLAKMTKKGQVNHSLGKVHAFAVSPDGKMIATTTENGKTLFLWDATTSRILSRKDPPLALSLQQVATLWDDLAHLDEKKSDDAWHKLGAAGDSAIPLLRQNVRALAVPHVDNKLIAKLVSDLGSAKFATRETAVKDLIATGESAILPLQRMLDKPPSLEAAARAKSVLQKIGEPELTPDRFRVLEAIDLLEQMGTAKARELLEEIERDALIAQIHIEAKHALTRMMASKMLMK